jgi:hypothetical protein
VEPDIFLACILDQHLICDSSVSDTSIEAGWKGTHSRPDEDGSLIRPYVSFHGAGKRVGKGVTCLVLSHVDGRVPFYGVGREEDDHDRIVWVVLGR